MFPKGWLDRELEKSREDLRREQLRGEKLYREKLERDKLTRERLVRENNVKEKLMEERVTVNPRRTKRIQEEYENAWKRSRASTERDPDTLGDMRRRGAVQRNREAIERAIRYNRQVRKEEMLRNRSKPKATTLEDVVRGQQLRLEDASPSMRETSRALVTDRDWETSLLS